MSLSMEDHLFLEKEFQNVMNDKSLNDFIRNLKINKLKTNLSELKVKIIQNAQSIDEYQSYFSNLEFDCDYFLNSYKSKCRNDNKLQDEPVANQVSAIDKSMGKRNSKLAYVTNAENDDDQTIENIDNSYSSKQQRNKDLQSLKERLFQRGGSLNSIINTENDNSVNREDEIQGSLITEISQLTSTLKENAQQFDQKLNSADKDVLSKTETNLSKTSVQLSGLGTKLAKFSNSRLGVMFYLSCVFFMIMSLLLTYMIIKIFPEM
ncbi:hypothetical protein ACO0RG_003411 [Hanseniaspora osmophila]|uniref:Protein transport protein USE1 n=1 Tax=Hanseniaspora osmophila TaxID=56408 RepID=A0A1E5RE65_9ASCO|nr:Protein transport protein USE1 [Hanseniaspora osmophila]